MNFRRLLNSLACSILCVTPLSAQDRPNVLMIVVDDLKPTLGCYGDQTAQTPHLDALAARGIRFTRAYANQAVCGPSRCSTFTGLRPDRTKVHDLKTDFLEVSPWVKSLPELFKDDAYFTAGTGKLFHGGKSDSIMESRAFDKIVHEGHLPYHPDHPKPVLGYQSPKAQQARAELPANQQDKWGKLKQALKQSGAGVSTEALDLPDDAYPDGAIAKQGIEFMNQAKQSGKPFFISLGFKRPHLPFTAPKKYWDLYERDQLPVASLQDLPEGAPKFAGQSWGELRNYADIPAKGDLSPEKAKEIVHGYYASTSYVDAQIGKVLTELKKRGLEKNTIVVLWSDHGWHLGDHGLWCKHSNYEQATRSVLMFAGPDIATNQESSALTELIDVFATTCELAKVEAPKNLDSKSLVKTLKDPSSQHRVYAQSQYPRWNGTMGYAFRSDTHRYVAWVKNPDPKNAPSSLPELVAEELYHLESDPAETTNLAASKDQPEITKALDTFRTAADQFLKSQAERIEAQPK